MRRRPFNDAFFRSINKGDLADQATEFWAMSLLFHLSDVLPSLEWAMSKNPHAPRKLLSDLQELADALDYGPHEISPSMAERISELSSAFERACSKQDALCAQGQHLVVSCFTTCRNCGVALFDVIDGGKT